MRLLFVNYEFPPLGGGAGKATYNLARELVALGHRVDVLTSRSSGGEPPREESGGLTVHRVPSWRKGVHDCGFRGAITFLLFALLPFSRLTAAHRYDLIHYFFAVPTGLLALLPGPHRRLPYLVSLRGSDVPGYDTYNTRLQRLHRLLLPLTGTILKHAAEVVAVTQSLKDTALRAFPAIAIRVVPNGVDAEFFSAPRPPGRSSGGRLKLICVARLIERKGVQDLLAALAALDNPAISLLIVGTGSYEERLKRLCGEMRLNGRVTFYGFCEPRLLPGLLARSDVFILPSRAEAFGNVFAEAMACGLPVIGSAVGGIPDIVGADNGILVKPGSVEAIQCAIRRVQEAGDGLAAMRAANREKALNRYSWRSVARQHLAVYREITREPVDVASAP